MLSVRSRMALTAAASMWDSTVDPGATGEVLAGVYLSSMQANPPGELVSSEHAPGATAVSAELGVGVDGSNGLVVTPDAAMLSGPNTTFPVFIDPQIAPVRSKWAYANSINSNWDVGGQAWVGKNPYDGTLYRSFFDFPTTYNGYTYKGKHVLAASFSIELDHSWSCSNTWAHLYRTGAITVSNGARMNWGTRPLGSGAKWLDSAEGHANEAGGCGEIQPNMIMTFGGNETMRADVQAAATAGWSTYTVGICACNSSGEYETSQERWKRFLVNSKTTMSVTYNTVPGTPANLSPHQGQVACGGVVGTTSPVLQAQYVDADSADTLSATFAWQQLPSGTLTYVAGSTKPANNNGTATLSLGSAAEGKSYQFQVRTYDGHDYSPWSPWCGFTVDTTAPPAPIITPVASGSAPVYAARDPGDISSCVARGGPGVAGAFTFSEPSGTAGQDVVKYVYGWDSPSVSVTVAPGAAYGPKLLTPPHYGLNTLTAYSVDGTGKQSATTSFRFLVGAPSAPLGRWPLDTIGGHNFNDQVSGAALTVTGDVSWTPDVRYIGASAASFDANPSDGLKGYATTAGPVLDTTKSFSVSAWVRPADLTDYHAAVAQDGVNRSRFMLYYSPTYSAWAFYMYNEDSDSTAGSVAYGGTPTVGRWAHLVGVYDAAAKQISLYVDGVLVGTSAHTPVWSATGSFSIGRRLGGGLPSQHWEGEIADVRAWNRVVVPDDIWGTDADPTKGVPAQVGLLSPLQVGLWQFPEGECYCTDSPDASLFSRKVFLSPNWSLDPNWSGDPATTPAWLTGDSQDGDGAVHLDGVSGFASTTDDNATVDPADDIAHPVLRTDQSFTVSAWVRMDRIDTYQMVLAQDGPVSSGFFLYYAPESGGKWKFKVWPSAASTDNTNATYAETLATPDVTTTWHHVVGVLDAGRRQISLYVDGQLKVTSTLNAAWQPWQATGSLTLGRAMTGGNKTGFLGGSIDQVQVWQGVLTAREIDNLYQTS